MYAQVEKPKENKSRAVANSVAQKKSNVKQGFGFVDNRVEAIAQRNLKEMTRAPLQPKWLDSKGPLLKWDVPVSGVRWYYIKSSGKMFYVIEKRSARRYLANAGEENAKPREAWVKLYGSDPLALADPTVIDEDEIFTDSESDSDDPTYDGLRVMDRESRQDLAEFDRARIGRGKIYEDKLAEFDQSKIPEKHRRPEAQLIQGWIKKQVIGKVARKLTVIQESGDNTTVRCFEDIGLSADVVMEWVSEVRNFKLVVFGESPILKEELGKAIIILRQKFPRWRITAKMGDPRAREDHDRMHGNL